MCEDGGVRCIGGGVCVSVFCVWLVGGDRIVVLVVCVEAERERDPKIRVREEREPPREREVGSF